MRAWPWLLGGGALAYALTRRSSHKTPIAPASVEPFTGTLPGRWVWPVGCGIFATARWSLSRAATPRRWIGCWRRRARGPHVPR